MDRGLGGRSAWHVLEIIPGCDAMEATPGIEPGYAVLQTAASPLRHVAEGGAPITDRRSRRQLHRMRRPRAVWYADAARTESLHQRKRQANHGMADYVQQRMNMVDAQVRANDVTDTRIHAAMREIPRERFVPQPRRAMAYADALVEVAPQRHLLDPRTFSKLLQLVEIRSSDTVLDVGCATGYSSAVLARLTKFVVALEQDADLVRIAVEALAFAGAANATVVQGRLAAG